MGFCVELEMNKVTAGTSYGALLETLQQPG